MPEKILVSAEVIAEHESAFEVRLDNGFGANVVMVAKEKAISFDRLNNHEKKPTRIKRQRTSA